MAAGAAHEMATKRKRKGNEEELQQPTTTRDMLTWKLLPWCVQIFQGPAQVPNTDGQEHVLLPIVGINGDWLYSSIEPENTLMG